jgi:tetratricopeptide (TPR) repeat protein
MTGFIALAFAASFSYNLFQVKEVNDAKSFLTDGTDVLTFDVVKYSEVLSGLAEGDAITTQGEREFLRNNFSDAATLANDAIKLLEPLLKETGIAEPGLLRNATFERSTCTNVMIASAMSPQPFTDGPHKSKEVEEKFSGLSPQTLRPALLEALFAAYDLHARGVFFGNAKYRDPIRHDGEVLLVINPTKWQGYHWVGLAAEDNAEFEQAKACFQNSVKNKPTVNKDHINLAELLFLDGRYEKATSEVLKYFPPDYRGFGSGTDVVAQFYLIASNYLSETPQPGILSPSNFMSNMAQLQNLRLEGSFLSTELDKALDETKPSGQNFAKKDRLKKAVVLKMAVCLKTRKCES